MDYYKYGVGRQLCKDGMMGWVGAKSHARFLQLGNVPVLYEDARREDA